MIINVKTITIYLYSNCENQQTQFDYLPSIYRTNFTNTSVNIVSDLAHKNLTSLFLPLGLLRNFSKHNGHFNNIIDSINDVQSNKIIIDFSMKARITSFTLFNKFSGIIEGYSQSPHPFFFVSAQKYDLWCSNPSDLERLKIWYNDTGKEQIKTAILSKYLEKLNRLDK